MYRAIITVPLSIFLLLQLGASTAETTKEHEELLYLGEKAFSEQLYDVAKEKLEKFLENYPESNYKEKVQELLAKTLFHLRDYSRSRALMLSLLDTAIDGSKKYEYYCWIGRNELRQGKFEEALKALDTAINGPADKGIVSLAKIEKAACLHGLGKAEESFKILDALIAEYSNKEEGIHAQLEKCRLLLSDGDYSNARDELILLIETRMPKELESRLFFLLGEAEFYLKDLDEAIAYYRKSLETGTYYDWFPEASYAIGWCRLKQGNHDKAAKIFEVMAEEHRDTHLGWKSELGTARALLLDEKMDEAAEMLEGIISRGPGNLIVSEAKYLLGDSAMANKLYDEAIRHYDAMVQEHPDSEFVPDAHFGKATALYVQKEYKKSLEEFSKVLAYTERPELVHTAMIRRADANFEMHEYTLALEGYTSVWESSSSADKTEKLLLKMGWCYYKLEDFDHAIATFSDLVEKYNDSDFADDAMYRLGGCYFRLGEFEKAIELYAGLKEEFPKSPLLDKVAYQTGVCNYHMGNYHLAGKAYAEVVDEYPDSILADRADYEIGWCKYNLPGKEEEALEHFTKHISERPKSAFAPEILFWMGEQYYNRSEFMEAYSRFSDLSKTYQKSFLADEALYWSGRAAMEIANDKEALAKFSERFEKSPREEAFARFNGLIERYPKSEFAIDSAYKASICNFELGKTKEGLEGLLKLRKTPGSDYLENDIRLKIAESYLKLDKMGEAFAEYEALSKCNDRKFRAWGLHGIGLYYMAQNQYPRAISSFMEVTWRYSNEKEVVGLSYLYAGDCYGKLGKKREAIDRYIVIVEGDLPHAEEAGERIRKMKKKSMLIFD